MSTIAIWNHDRVNDRTVITSGGNVTVIGPGAMQEFEGKLGEEILAEAKRSGVPFSTEPASGVIVGGQVFVKSPESRVQSPESSGRTLMVPIGIFDRANLLRLDRDLLVQIAACLGSVLGADSTKKALVETILRFSGSANVPPTVTGENQPAQPEQEK